MFWRSLTAFCILVAALFCEGQQPRAVLPHPPAPGSPADLVERGQKLSSAGKQDEALALYAQALNMAPNFYEAHLESGIALDLKGDYAKAQEKLAKAVDVAPVDSKQEALRALAFSFTFSGDAFKASEPEMQVFNARLAKGDSVGAAAACNELARIYLELGDPDHAFKWYKMGYDTVSRKADLSDPDKALWLFRWESAQARVADRRGNGDEARQHLAPAKAALDKANNPDQARFYPYLTGYLAFYANDYKTAIADLQNADQRDPFILVLLAQSYEKQGDAAQARDYYRKVLEINVHNPTNAFARPLAKKRLAAGS